MRVCDWCGRKLGFGACTVTITKFNLFHSYRTLELCSRCVDRMMESRAEAEKDEQGVE